MLVLSRKCGESLVIGDDIKITVTHVGRGRVRIGVDAPKDVQIRRSELTAEARPLASKMLMACGCD